MSENKNKILVAIDGSKKSFKTVEYLCNFLPFLDKEIVLYHVISAVPDCYYDLKREAFSGRTISEVRAWEVSHKNKIKNFMEKSRRLLIASGFKSKAITIAIENRKKGTARDIMAKANKGYHALLIRRRGTIASLLPVAMGSISTKLVEKNASIPVLLAGVQKVNHAIFIAVDGSEGSKRAVEFLGSTIRNSTCKIVICSVLRDFEVYDEKEHRKMTAECVGARFEEIEGIMDETKKHLASVGIKRENIVTKIIQGATSRAAAIVEAAKEEGCDTIVFGRKGRTHAASFDIGRVPWKVIHGAKKMTVWIVP